MDNHQLDYKRLISLVKGRRELYDTSLADYRNRERIASIWIYIANEMRTNVMEVKSKWQMLRCNYMREKKKVQRRISEGSSSNASPTTWSYFYMLTFLDAYKDDSSTRESSIEQQSSEFGSPSSSSYDVQAVNVKRELFENNSSDTSAYESSSVGWKHSILDSERIVESTSNNEKTVSEFKANQIQADRWGLTKSVRVEVDIKPSVNKRKLSIEDSCGMKVCRQTASPEPSERITNFDTQKNHDNSSDSDQQFFSSLLPFTKGLSQTQNLEFRSGVINLLLAHSNK